MVQGNVYGYINLSAVHNYRIPFLVMCTSLLLNVCVSCPTTFLLDYYEYFDLTLFIHITSPSLVVVYVLKDVVVQGDTLSFQIQFTDRCPDIFLDTVFSVRLMIAGRPGPDALKKSTTILLQLYFTDRGYSIEMFTFFSPNLSLN